ncbi:hypothetical protein FHX82_000552 [Amycolatopsis bartoniae]|uniref:Uncharacterized protein n=1 Tax=Amycolatopsis bartoniae TaxID=941986 RepID=A0A8H9IW55_9PSEU|nr:hypothetical protein [Amycolatopsis bartoniae]MBB2933532.1 hypothetical protein [Amycolatopsis bartoniae]GHF60138.1 hypothetical protein GCM10017566_37210 [Amycolatopsis bartoniae]
MSTTLPDLPQRALSMLRAVASGRAEMTCSCEPDLFIDGLACCDQVTARLLSHAGLIRPARPGALGQRVPVRLTDAGRHVLQAEPLEAA